MPLKPPTRAPKISRLKTLPFHAPERKLSGIQALQQKMNALRAENEILTKQNLELKKTNQVLSKTENRFRTMVEGVRDYAIFMLDAQGQIASWNEGARRFKGYESSEILGKHFSVFYPKEDVAACKPQKELDIARVEGRLEDEGWRIRKDGSRFWANVVITRISNPDGGLAGFSKVTRDLTERKNAELFLQRAKEELEIKVRDRTAELERALKSRDEFLSIASREFKTPLTSLKLQLQMSQRALNLDPTRFGKEQMNKALAFTVAQADRLAHLVDDLLDLSRIRIGKFEITTQTLNLSTLVKEVISALDEQLRMAECTLSLHLENDVTGSWDGNRIEQVVTNLLSNVVKYAFGSNVRISSCNDGDFAVLEVEDFGPGIEKDKVGKLFKRFERANHDKGISGLGLGLFIVKRIVDAHSGTITVESEVGKGTKFTLRFPKNESL